MQTNMEKICCSLTKDITEDFSLAHVLSAVSYNFFSVNAQTWIWFIGYVTIKVSQIHAS